MEKYLDNSGIGMSKEAYLRMCFEMGDEPDPNKIPPEITDFPIQVHQAFEIYNALSDNYVNNSVSVVFVGKDYSAFDIVAELVLVPKEDRLEVFRIVQFLDSRARQQALKDAEKAAKKLSKK